jgi:glucosamine--fructose-6-phosphate aminotransferase (isomerizing)
MRGWVGEFADRNIGPIMLEWLKHLEYRDCDSAGFAIVDASRHTARLRQIRTALTRWAIHGVPSERDSHAHFSASDVAIMQIAVIENRDELRVELDREGYSFSSETETEVFAHRIDRRLKSSCDLFEEVRATVAEIEGANTLQVVSEHDPYRIIVAREGYPVVIGIGVGENCVASDVAALLP